MIKQNHFNQGQTGCFKRILNTEMFVVATVWNLEEKIIIFSQNMQLGVKDHTTITTQYPTLENPKCEETCAVSLYISEIIDWGIK